MFGFSPDGSGLSAIAEKALRAKATEAAVIVSFVITEHSPRERLSFPTLERRRPCLEHGQDNQMPGCVPPPDLYRGQTGKRRLSPKRISISLRGWEGFAGVRLGFRFSDPDCTRCLR